ncbi:MAG: hypothetical protein ACI92G_003549 [Candidatus Pelagisphaera sp.]|jgi:hypothetical protein
MPYRQIVVTIPKRLRKAFQFDRQLLTSLCQTAWLSLRDVIRIRLGTPVGQPGVVIAIQTFGDYLNYHPHLHILITDGAFVGSHTFHALHRGDWEQVAELPFASFLDGIVYEPEPWEQARRERLASYARERDDLAGIVVYDGEWDQTPPYCSDIPLGQWATEANRWDGVDPIPPDEEPVFYADEPAGFKIPAGQYRSGRPQAFCSK